VSAERAAIVTGASGGIGVALARMLGEEGHALTITARRQEELDPVVRLLRDSEIELQAIAADFSGPGCEEAVHGVVAAHRERYGRLDVLCNNAGASMGAALEDVSARRLDIQVNVNLRQIVFFYRESIDLLRAAAAEHHNVNVINTSSVLGKSAGAWLSVYSATKHAIVGWTQAMNEELAQDGIKSCALCPDLVDTPMSRVFATAVAPESMITTSDVAEMARAVIRLSPRCFVPEVILAAPDAHTRTGSMLGVATSDLIQPKTSGGKT
jgi:short-subunit dehydrogenase